MHCCVSGLVLRWSTAAERLIFGDGTAVLLAVVAIFYFWRQATKWKGVAAKLAHLGEENSEREAFFQQNV